MNNEIRFRRLKADEIELRPVDVTESGARLLLYKDARCDRRILDETVGCGHWMRRHPGGPYCTVFIEVAEGKWVDMTDAGAAARGDDKALASDAFKRACFAWGIGVELYSAPPVWISKADAAITKDDKGNPVVLNNFCVSHIAYKKNEDGTEGEKITELVISLFDPSTGETGREVFRYPSTKAEEVTETTETTETEPAPELDFAKRKSICDELVRIGADQERLNRFLKPLNKAAIKELSEMEADKLLAWLNKQKSKQ